MSGRMRIVNPDGSDVVGTGERAAVGADGGQPAVAARLGFGMIEGWGSSWIDGVRIHVCNHVVSETPGSSYYHKVNNSHKRIKIYHCTQTRALF